MKAQKAIVIKRDTPFDDNYRSQKRKRNCIIRCKICCKNSDQICSICYDCYNQFKGCDCGDCDDCDDCD